MNIRDDTNHAEPASNSAGHRVAPRQSARPESERAKTTPSSALTEALIVPVQSTQAPPCSVGCGSGGDVRGWIAVVAQREKLGLSKAQSFTRAWKIITEANPFPATLGRICPHPCESGCNRGGQEGAIAINALERFLGDWALHNKLGLPRLAKEAQPESIGVVGAGPAGISFAYQMARRGYRVTIYEKQEKPGGMLYYGIPQYRLPEDVLDAEIQRVLDLGVELKLNAAIDGDADIARLKKAHDVLFLGIGASIGIKLGILGEDGPGAWTGTEYLGGVNRGEPADLGDHAVVVGGGNTAMDAARAARRAGARVTVLYRRTRAEMPAIASEIDDALAEGVHIEYLAAPVQIKRENGRLTRIQVQRMALGEADNSGRRKPEPVPGSEYWLDASAVIAAVSQASDWASLGELGMKHGTHKPGEVENGVWTGGDAAGLGIAGFAIAQGRQAAEKVHAQLRGLRDAEVQTKQAIGPTAVRPDYHAEKARAELPHKAVAERLAQPDAEVQQTLTEKAFLDEISRCFSCGQCFGCEQCFMYCNAGAYTKLAEVRPGAYFAFNLDACERCGKCIELCPCGFLTRCSDTTAQGVQN